MYILGATRIAQTSSLEGHEKVAAVARLVFDCIDSGRYAIAAASLD